MARSVKSKTNILEQKEAEKIIKEKKKKIEVVEKAIKDLQSARVFTYKLAAMDNGKDNLKLKWGPTEADEVVYSNRMQRGFVSEDFITENTYLIEIDGEKYTVGEGAENGDYNEGKDDQCHILNALASLTNVVSTSGDKVILVYGESMTFYRNPKHIQRLKSLLEKRHIIIVNGVKYDFEIETLHVLPEGIGLVLQDLEKYWGTQYIVDMGGSTFNYLKVINGIPQQESFSKIGGKNKLVKELQMELTNNDLPISDRNELNTILEDGSENEIIEKCVDNAIKNRMEDIKGSLSEAGFDIMRTLKTGSNNVHFVGGTTELLEDDVVDYFKVKDDLTNEVYTPNIPENPLMSTVRGFYEFAVAKYSDKLKKEEKQA